MRSGRSSPAGEPAPGARLPQFVLPPPAGFPPRVRRRRLRRRWLPPAAEPCDRSPDWCAAEPEPGPPRPDEPPDDPPDEPPAEPPRALPREFPRPDPFRLPPRPPWREPPRERPPEGFPRPPVSPRSSTSSADRPARVRWDRGSRPVAVSAIPRSLYTCGEEE